MKLSKDIGREELIEKQGDSEFQTFFQIHNSSVHWIVQTSYRINSKEYH